MISRYFSLLLVILTVSVSYGKTTNNLKNTTNGFAKIIFVDNNADHSKTYLGKLTKGDLQSLKYELQNSFAEPVVTIGGKSKSESDGYVNRVTSKKTKYNAKKRERKAKNDLLGNYTIDDEKSLVKIKEKREKEEVESKDKFSRNYKVNSDEQVLHKPNRSLAKHYRISTGRRIHNGQSFRKRAGYVSMIIKYKIREGNQISTYVTIVEDYLKEGSKYNLKYHGNGSKRKYYLEFDSAPVR
jgi:hypothetical protein